MYYVQISMAIYIGEFHPLYQRQDKVQTTLPSYAQHE